MAGPAYGPTFVGRLWSCEAIRPATGISRALRARSVPESAPESVPKNGLATLERMCSTTASGGYVDKISDILFPYRSPSPRPHPNPTQHPETHPKRTQTRPETEPNGAETKPNGAETERNQAFRGGTGGGFVGVGGWGVVREKEYH